ncbi:MAG: HAD hydrolase family protein, partial [Longicatena sp.]
SFFHDFDFDGAIYDGGALVMEHGQVIAKSLIHEEQTAKLINYAKQEKFPVRYSTFDNDCIIEKCSPRIKDEFFKLYLNMPIIKDYEGEEVFNLLAYPTSHAQQLQVETLLDQCSIVHHAATLEITAKGIDKSIGVKTLTNKWGIDMSEVICFGDGANDVIMLQEAGLGIALGNANEKAKKAADRVCGHIDEDGV